MVYGQPLVGSRNHTSLSSPTTNTECDFGSLFHLAAFANRTPVAGRAPFGGALARVPLCGRATATFTGAGAATAAATGAAVASAAGPSLPQAPSSATPSAIDTDHASRFLPVIPVIARSPRG